jgi:hypothetical protein
MINSFIGKKSEFSFDCGLPGAMRRRGAVD